jgi:hypothetical protein
VNLIDFASKALKNIRKTGSLLYIRILVPQFNPLTTGNGVYRAEPAFSLGGSLGFRQGEKGQYSAALPNGNLGSKAPPHPNRHPQLSMRRHQWAK